MRSQLIGVPTIDTSSIGAAVLSLVLVTLVSCVLPTWRAVRLDVVLSDSRAVGRSNVPAAMMTARGKTNGGQVVLLLQDDVERARARASASQWISLKLRLVVETQLWVFRRRGDRPFSGRRPRTGIRRRGRC